MHPKTRRKIPWRIAAGLRVVFSHVTYDMCCCNNGTAPNTLAAAAAWSHVSIALGRSVRGEDVIESQRRQSEQVSERCGIAPFDDDFVAEHLDSAYGLMGRSL